MPKSSHAPSRARRDQAASRSRLPVVLPSDAKAALAAAPKARAAYERLSYTHRREYVEAITSAKRPETRERRIATMMAKLLSDHPSPSSPASTRPTVRKMAIQPGQRVLVLDADEAAMATWVDLPEGCVVDRKPGRQAYDVVVLYAATAAELARRLPAALRACHSAAVLWVGYLKQTSDRASTLTRDTGWEPTMREDLKPVAMIAFDQDWAGIKFRLLPTQS